MIFHGGSANDAGKFEGVAWSAGRVVLGGVGASDGPQQWGNLGACWPWQGSPPLYNTLARSNVYLGSWYVVVAPQLLARWCRAAPRPRALHSNQPDMLLVGWKPALPSLSAS